MISYNYLEYLFVLIRVINDLKKYVYCRFNNMSNTIQKALMDPCIVTKNLYGFTWKILDKKEPTEQDYTNLMKKCGNSIDFIDFVFENRDKKGLPTKLHIHGVFLTKDNKQFYFRKVFSKGVHTKIEGIYDINGWNKYMNKNIGYNDKHNRVINNKEYMF